MVNEDGGETFDYETLDVLSFALIELRDGSHETDVVVQRSLDSTRYGEGMEPDDDDIRSCSRKKFASEMGYKQYLVKPPAGATPMLPIPPGTVRGHWVTPALTSSDKRKIITISGNVMRVGGAERIVEWGHIDVPTNVKGMKIVHVGSYREGQGTFRVEGASEDPYLEFCIPYLAEDDTQQQVDLAFAMVMDKSDSGAHATRFYMPVKQGYKHHELVQAGDVTFGDQCFRCFVGALRA